MSMRQLELDPDLDAAQDEPWIEDEIQKELAALSPTDLSEPYDDHAEDAQSEQQTADQSETENEVYNSNTGLVIAQLLTGPNWHIIISVIIITGQSIHILSWSRNEELQCTNF